MLNKIRTSCVSKWFAGVYHRELHERTRAVVSMVVLQKEDSALILSSFSLQMLVEVEFVCRRDWGGPNSLECTMRHHNVERGEEVCALERWRHSAHPGS